MIQIKRMFHVGSGEIVFEDVNEQWWRIESYNPEPGTAHEWMPTVATKIDKPNSLDT